VHGHVGSDCPVSVVEPTVAPLKIIVCFDGVFVVGGVAVGVGVSVGVGV
jgi:hypothetical protein